jgi:23S rRNA pseudouridine1911/1915/1917 synthase
MRLDAYAAQLWPEQSRSTWKKRIEAGHVSVNGAVQVVPKYDVSESDVITAVELPTDTHAGKSLPVIYEDDNVIVIDKPVGVLTHSKGALNDEFTVAEFVRPLTSYKSNTKRPGIIHRLDRATSGVIICAKNDATASYLQRQFSERTTKKIYSAVTSGVPKQTEAIIDLPIARSPSAPSTFRVEAGGKHAETYYEVQLTSDSRALVTLRPKTGRTHQLRVHLAYLGTPILGDVVYGSEAAERMYLHAASLEITLPGGNRRVFESNVPASFKAAVAP